jgi:hypothetical protein
MKQLYSARVKVSEYKSLRVQGTGDLKVWNVAMGYDADGHTAKDEPYASGPTAESEKRYHAFQPATGGGHGGTAGGD